MPDLPPLSNNRPKAPRKSTGERGYDYKHQQARKLLLAMFPLCQINGPGCTGWATEAHHKRYGSDLTIEDYVSVCGVCHRSLKRAV
jgi:hypothetical protein